MSNEDSELIHKGVKISVDQDEDLKYITEQIKITKPRRKWSVTLREALDEGIKVLKKRYDVK